MNENEENGRWTAARNRAPLYSKISVADIFSSRGGESPTST